MTQQGFIKLQRKIQDHWIYQEKRKFSRYEAWLDMLMMANHKDNKFVLGNELVEVSKGSFVTSELKLMSKWDWGKAKLRAFLEMLENDGMIVKKSDRKKTTITICNYCIYHDYENETRPQTDHEQTISRPSADTNKNVKNDKNEKNNKDIYTIFNHWKEKGIVVHKTLNQKMESHINARLQEHDVSELITAIDNYHEILTNDAYYWTHRWTLQDFMKPNNVIRFLDSSKPMITFKAKAGQSSEQSIFSQGEESKKRQASIQPTSSEEMERLKKWEEDLPY